MTNGEQGTVLIAPAKLNLCLYVGVPRGDGMHEIRSLFSPISLADRIEVRKSDRDEVVCPQVGGENLAAAALRALRERGWDGPPLRIEIAKRIPLAAGLGGGSADAAAVLRLAEGLQDIDEVAEKLGADVLSQLRPGFALVAGVGERVEPLPSPGEHAIVLLPQDQGLRTADVYAEADRLGLGRDAAELDALANRLREVAAEGASPLEYARLLFNDLEPAATSLRPQIEADLESLRDAGAVRALISGSGPTSFGLFADREAAEAAASALGRRALVSTPVNA
jgi:4-diphosphocytidyl-2-C-methyl-D-erythritol kinase